VGRKIYQGWPYFAWSQGYDTNKRGKLMEQMLGAEDKTTACRLLEKNKIDYVEIKLQNPPDPDVPTISSIYSKKFAKVYDNTSQNLAIYNVKETCN
jgi:hypothetical protein